MTFDEAMNIVINIVNGLDPDRYDGIIVKRLESSNTLDEGRSSNQTHIAISGDQMNIFPYLMADGYFKCDYELRDEQLKKYFITQIPVYISKVNVNYLSDGAESTIAFSEHDDYCVHVSVVRSRRKAQADQVQLSLTSVDDQDFVAFRKLLHAGDYFIILKQKEKMKYDCVGVKKEDAENGEYRLSELNNRFYKLPTNTVVRVDDLIIEPDKTIDVDCLLKIEKNEKFAKEAMRILIEEIGFTPDMIKKLTDIEWSGKITKRALPILLEVPADITKEELNKLISDSNGKNRFYSDLYDILGKKYAIINNWYYKGKSGIDNRTPFVEWIKELLRSKGINYKQEIKKRKTGAKNILLYGVPGSGKSHTIKTEYCSDRSKMERVVFHPDYTYSDFVGQILPRVESDESGNERLKYVFTPGPFTKLLKKAYEDPENKYYLVIEELNRGNAPAIFGEIFQLLDRKDAEEFPEEEVGESEYGISNYEVATYVYGDEDQEIRIPSNMYVLATMNTADQNVFTLDTAFQRRWSMKQVKNSFDDSEHAKDMIAGTNISWGVFATVINEILASVNSDLASTEDKRLGLYFAKKCELKEQEFGDKVLKYLWDDALKMDRENVFKEDCKTLEEVVTLYEKAKEDRLSAVLQAGVYKDMLSRMQKNSKSDGN